MYAEVINAAIIQTVADTAPITTADGVQYPAAWPKADIPNLVAVVDPGPPDPTAFLVTGTTVTLVGGVPTLAYQTEAVAVPPPPPAPTLAQVQATQSTAVSASCRAAITAGFASSALGAANAYPLPPPELANLQLAYSAAQAALVNAKAWASGAVVPLFEVVVAGGATYLAMTAGTTGAAQPAWPSGFQQAVTDGTVQWALAGWMLMTGSGRQWHTPPQVVAVWQAALNLIATAHAQETALLAEVAAATTVADVQAVTW